LIHRLSHVDLKIKTIASYKDEGEDEGEGDTSTGAGAKPSREAAFR